MRLLRILSPAFGKFLENRMFEIAEENAIEVNDARPVEASEFDLHSYEIYALQFSGGKDSIASLLALLEAGVDPSKIELHHQLVDGRESTLMDWPITEGYVRALAKAFNLPLFNSWRVGGIEREMLRSESRTAPVSWETDDGTIRTVGGDGGTLGTRLKFPQVGADLRTRWCSGVAKIDVFARVMTNDPRFQNKRTLVITGERGEESSNRAKYKVFEPHRTDLRNGRKIWRHVDHWRPVHSWTEAMVWNILEKWRVAVHPAYHLGWNRCSCRSCIFGNCDQWATIRTYMPDAFEPIATYERQFKITIHRSRTVNEQSDLGTPYPCTFEMLQIAESLEYLGPIFLPAGEWKLPVGAFQGGCGPS
jgi:3'-phosphoadenosine 5'-phosphosulfate sulfotransferase (PAPS reductase)/FAD synthetase